MRHALVGLALALGALALGFVSSPASAELPTASTPRAELLQQGSCGDRRCQPPEDCRSCPDDCGSCCGDYRCQPPEDCRSCPGDCGPC